MDDSKWGQQFAGSVFLLAGLASWVGALYFAGQRLLTWLKTDTWMPPYTVADAFPTTAARLAETQWLGVQHIVLWLVSLSMATALFFVGLLCVAVGIGKWSD